VSALLIWPATADGRQATGASSWRQDSHWLVIETTGDTDSILAGPMSKDDAHRELTRLRRKRGR